MEFGLTFVQLKGWYELQCFLDKTYIRFDFKNSVKPRQKTNLKVLLINNVVREKGGILMICNPVIMASK